MNRVGATFCGEYHFVMPYNIHFAFDEKFIRQIVREDKKLLDILFYNLSHGVAPVVKSNIFYDIAAFFVGIQAIGGAINSFFIRSVPKSVLGADFALKIARTETSD